MTKGPSFARRVELVRPFRVMELLDRALTLERDGHDIIHLEVGEPDFTTAEPILRAGREALDRHRTRYTSAAGLPELRAAIARHYVSRYGVDITSDQVIVTPGATGGLLLLAALLIDQGQELLLADPGYPCNRHFPYLVGGVPVAVPVAAAEKFQLTGARVDAAWSEATAAVLVASPGNPTGTVVPDQEWDEILGATRAHGGWLVVDEIYQGLTYPASLGETDAMPSGRTLAGQPDVFVVNSFSKYFGMTGWRLGWIVAPKRAVPELTKLAQNFIIAPPTLSQHAALAALEDEAMAIHEARRRAFLERRNFLVPALEQLGFHVPVIPEGAFYVYANIAALGLESPRLCDLLLERHGVAITPGTDFGEFGGLEHVRISYAASLERLEQAVKRIALALDRGLDR